MNDAELVVTEQLAMREVQLLAQCEAVIQADIKAFIRVGQALATINNERLYRSEFLSFEEYTATKWDMGRSYAHRLIDANTVNNNLAKLLPDTSLLVSPIGDTETTAEDRQKALESLLPKNEAQARALTKYKDDPAKLLEVWTTAIKTAPPGKCTAKHVENTVERMTMAEQQVKVKRTREVMSLDDKEKVQSPEFKAAFNAFWAVLNTETMSRFATTSKEAFRQAARGILQIVGE